MSHRPDKPKDISEEEFIRLSEQLDELEKFSPRARQYVMQWAMSSLGGPGFTQVGHSNRGRGNLNFDPLYEEHFRRLKHGEASEVIAHEAKYLRTYEEKTLGNYYPHSVVSITRKLLARHGVMGAPGYKEKVKYWRSQ